VYKIPVINETVEKQSGLIMIIYSTNNKKISKTAKIEKIEGNIYIF
jgi:hypothetical protein